MLVQFTVENFLSIRDKVYLSLEPSKDSEHPENLITKGDYKTVNSVAIYGANASGKSSLFKAITVALIMIRNSNNVQITDKLPMTPFKFDFESRNKPTPFEFTFIAKDGRKYIYGFSATTEKIVEEYLYCYNTSKPTLLFDLNENEKPKFNRAYKVKLEAAYQMNTANKLFLATATTWNVECTKSPFEWLAESIDTFTDDGNSEESENTVNTDQITEEDTAVSTDQITEEEFPGSDIGTETDEAESSESEEIQQDSDEGLILEEPSAVIRKAEGTEDTEEAAAPEEIFGDGENQEQQEDIFTDDIPAAGTSEKETDVESTEIYLYAMNDTYSSVISMPDTMQTSYQIQTSGKNPVYTVVSGYTAKVSETGLVTPKMQYVTYVDKNGNDVKSQWEYMFGETLISVQDGNSTVYYKFILKDYAEYYAEQKMDTFLKENITAEMSDYKKVATIARWLANNFNYRQYHSGYTGLMLDGGGDCWANTSAVNYMCEKLGLTVYARYAANDPGAGSGHRNSVVIIDGERYLVDCGYTGNAPRHYELSKMDYDYSYKILNDGTLSLYQYEGTDTNIVVPDTID